jgi:hypothetical protein
MATFCLPGDPFDRKLVHDAFPGDWKNPPPTALYDLIVGGGGPRHPPFPTQAEAIRAAAEVALRARPE